MKVTLRGQTIHLPDDTDEVTMVGSIVRAVYGPSRWPEIIPAREGGGFRVYESAGPRNPGVVCRVAGADWPDIHTDGGYPVNQSANQTLPSAVAKALRREALELAAPGAPPPNLPVDTPLAL